MVNIQDKRNCTGCSACVDICPKGAITLKTDIEGFWYPEVDQQICVDCSLCNKVCPVEHYPDVSGDNTDSPKCFAAINKNLYVRFDSTSGGAFSALANPMFREGGYVGGASTDETFQAKQILVDNKQDLERIRSSKYYQSDAREYYKEIKKCLENNKKVLACGAPCQMAALRNYIGKDDPNLIIVEFICLCMPSPKVFRKYIDDIEEQHGSPVVSTKAKSKELGWRRLTQMFILENGRRVYQTHDKNPFQYFYMNTRTNVRPSCYTCKFKGFPRVADITIGDYWCDNQEDAKTNEFKREFDNDIGTSVIIANNKKGLDYIEKCKTYMKIQEVPLEVVKKGNPALLNPIRESTIDREDFFNRLEGASLSELEKYYRAQIGESNKDKIKNVLKRYHYMYKYLGIHLSRYIKTFTLNGVIKTLFSQEPFILPMQYSIIKWSKSQVNLDGNMVVGIKRVKGSKLETRMIVEGTGTIQTKGEVLIGYGSDIEVFDGGHLTMGHCWMNMGVEIICADSITIGDYVGIGRNVSIRDNNGGHFMNRTYYQNSRPVIIEDKVWICSNVTIMPGVKIGEGAIIGENSFVTENVPPYTMVSGNPAKVVDEDVLFSWPSV